MKRTNGVPKAKIMKQLRKRGVTARRITNGDGKRVWQTSDGQQFKGLRDIANHYKLSVSQEV